MFMKCAIGQYYLCGVVSVKDVPCWRANISCVIKNSGGDRTLPCGTPVSNGNSGDVVKFMDIAAVRWSWKLHNNLTVISGVPGSDIIYTGSRLAALFGRLGLCPFVMFFSLFPVLW